MARFFGIVGYGKNEEVRPGVWDDVIVERKYYGDVVRNSLSVENADKVNDNRTVGNSISILADDDAYNSFMDILYVQWMGRNWEVSNIDVQPPRLVLRLGGVYTGPTAPTA